jgi:outer membrane lipoprotein LolB
MIVNFAKNLGLFFFVLHLSGCAMFSDVKEAAFHGDNRAHLYGLGHWRLNGRIAVFAPHDSWTAQINWRHQQDHDRLLLSGPLGQGAVAIELEGNTVTIDRGGGNVLTSNQPEQLINQQIGVFVPVRSLRYWAVGVPAMTSDFQKTSDGFLQEGWLIAYSSMQKVGQETLPHKMTVTKASVKLKMVIDQWDLNGDDTN